VIKPMRTKIFLTLFLAFFALLLISSCAPTRAALPTAFPASTIAATNTSMKDLGCSSITVQPTPYIASGLPAVTSEDYTRGPARASVTMILYCDFQSVQCQNFGDEMNQLLTSHPDDLRVVFRPLPAIGILDKSQISTQAVLAAGDQDKFWEMRDLLHSKYKDWENLSPSQFNSWITEQAAGIGLDAVKFDADYRSAETATRAVSMHDSAMQLGINNIPGVFINNNLQPQNLLDYSSVNDVVSLIALGERQFSSCPSFTIDPSREYIATLHTVKGDIVIQLLADKAPLTVNSFVFLARKGWFDGATFHRVIPGFVAQTGDPSGTGKGGPGYFFKNEVSDLKYDKPGVVGMANSGPDTNGSQFFITYAPQPSLDGGYTIFGQVIKGMDVAESLTPRDPSQSADLPPGDAIVSVTIEEK